MVTADINNGQNILAKNTKIQTLSFKVQAEEGMFILHVV